MTHRLERCGLGHIVHTLERGHQVVTSDKLWITVKTISRLLGETRLDSISGARHGQAAKGVPLGGRLGLREGERSDHLPTSRK